jgi:hypothetical protein
MASLASRVIHHNLDDGERSILTDVEYVYGAAVRNRMTTILHNDCRSGDLETRQRSCNFVANYMLFRDSHDPSLQHEQLGLMAHWMKVASHGVPIRISGGDVEGILAAFHGLWGAAAAETLMDHVITKIEHGCSIADALPDMVYEHLRFTVAN